MGEKVEIDSDVYRMTFFGILNAQGAFWTPLAVDSEGKARQHIRDFWGNNHEERDRCMRSHKIVPVRIRLEAKDHPLTESPTRATLRP